MQSAAGYYVGCSCKVEYDDGQIYEEPYCRDSGYFDKEDDALLYLAYIDPDTDCSHLVELNKQL